MKRVFAGLLFLLCSSLCTPNVRRTRQFLFLCETPAQPLSSSGDEGAEGAGLCSTAGAASSAGSYQTANISAFTVWKGCPQQRWSLLRQEGKTDTWL